MNPNTDFETVTARGDHGGITFRKSDGTVVARDFDSGYEDDPDAGYPFIMRANPNTLTNDPMDVLHVGYYFQMPGGAVCYELPVEDDDLAPPLPKTEPKSMKPMKPFDLAKAKAGAPVITRDGHKAHILSFDLCNRDYPMAAAFTDSDGNEWVNTLTNEGKCFAFADKDSPSDLFMAPVKKECWVNVNKAHGNPFGFGIGGKYATKEDADDMASPNRVACVHIEWEE
jgi:hypothetical protein